MYRTTLVDAIHRSPVSKNETEAKLIMTRDDEIFDPGTEYLTFATGDNEKPFYTMPVSDLLGFTSHGWIAFGIEYMSEDHQKVFWISGENHLRALQELGFNEFDMLEEML